VASSRSPRALPMCLTARAQATRSARRSISSPRSPVVAARTARALDELATLPST
jgi:hypothetical protein